MLPYSLPRSQSWSSSVSEEMLYPCTCTADYKFWSIQNPRFVLASEQVMEFDRLEKYIGRPYHRRGVYGYSKSVTIEKDGKILPATAWVMKCDGCGRVIECGPSQPQVTKTPAFKMVLSKY